MPTILKYATDLTLLDRIIMDGEPVILDGLESIDNGDRVAISGYFEWNGDDVTFTVLSDFAFRVRA